MEYTAVFAVPVWIVTVFLARGMAEKRAKSPQFWGLATVLFSPIVTLPLLWLFPVRISDAGKEHDATPSSQTDPTPHSELENNTQKYGKRMFVWAALVAFAVCSVFWLSKTAMRDEFQNLLNNNDLGHVSVTSVRMSPLALFGGRNEVDVFVEEKSGDLVRLNSIVVGSPLGEYYIEIPAIELLKIRF